MNWWGKILGGTFGFMMGGPLGAALGAALGHQFDKGIKNISMEGSPENDQVKAAFFTATFSVMGHVAKADGYVSDAEIALTTMLASSEPSSRLHLMDELTKLPAAVARRWLRWLLDDVDGEVRLRALTMMATTGDPQLFDLARRRAVEDADERVVKLAAQIMQSQKKR